MDLSVKDMLFLNLQHCLSTLTLGGGINNERFEKTYSYNFSVSVC